MDEIINEINKALSLGIEPEKLASGTFENYLMKNTRSQPIAIFKPFKQNQKIFSIKEHLAYLLDYDLFAGVPPTTLAIFSHPLFGEKREGSCQQYCEGRHVKLEDIESLDPSTVRTTAILDIRLLNMDRNLKNLLINNNKLIPIDHNLILSSYYGECYFEWSDWPQSSTPFSENDKQYIKKIDAEKERAFLIKSGIPLAAANLAFFSCYLLKEATTMNMTVNDLAHFLELRRGRLKEKFSWRLHFFKNLFQEINYKESPLVIDEFIVNKVRLAFNQLLDEKRGSTGTSTPPALN